MHITLEAIMSDSENRRTIMEREIKSFNYDSRKAAEKTAMNINLKQINAIPTPEGYDKYYLHLLFDDSLAKEKKKVYEDLGISYVDTEYSCTQKYIAQEKDSVMTGYSGTVSSSGDVNLHSDWSDVTVDVEKEKESYFTLKTYYFMYKKDKDPFPVIKELIRFRPYKNSNKGTKVFAIIFAVLIPILLLSFLTLDALFWLQYLATVEDPIISFINNPNSFFLFNLGIKAVTVAVIFPIVYFLTRKEIFGFKLMLIATAVETVFIASGLWELFLMDNPPELSAGGAILTAFVSVLSRYITPVVFVVATIVIIMGLVGFYGGIKFFLSTFKDFKERGGKGNLEELTNIFLSNKK